MQRRLKPGLQRANKKARPTTRLSVLGRALLIPDPEVFYASAQALIGYLARAGRFTLPEMNTAVGHINHVIRNAAEFK